MNHKVGSVVAITGALLGTAVGDALGVPYENLSPRRAVRLLGPANRHRFLLGRGMVSDDTEHSCLVAQALIASAGEPERFAQRLAWGLRGWLLSAPAGIGLATLRACLKLCLGFGPHSSGVYSAGNGPAMRSAIIGAAVADLPRLRALTRLHTRMTHTDPKAEYAALAVALAARHAVLRTPTEYLDLLRTEMPPEAVELIARIEAAATSAGIGESTAEFAAAQGWSRGVSGYAYHTVPVALHAWLRHPDDFTAAVSGAIACGGDADSVAAITGGIVGAGLGLAGIPSPWLDGLAEWPGTVGWMRRLAELTATAVTERMASRPPRLTLMLLWPRNLFFFGVVLMHVLRRWLPPY